MVYSIPFFLIRVVCSYIPLELVLLGVATVLALLVAFYVASAEAVFSSLTDKEPEADDIENTPYKYLLQHPTQTQLSLVIANYGSRILCVLLLAFGFESYIGFSYATWGQLAGFVLLIFCIIWFFTQLLPQLITSKSNPIILPKLAQFTLINYKIQYPFTKLLQWLSNWSINYEQKNTEQLSVDQLSKAFELTSDEINDEKDILEGIIKFHEKAATQIMTSRIDIFAIESSIPFNQVIKKVVEAGYSRIPVYTGTLDSIKGVLYIKDLLPHLDKPAGFAWQQLIRQAYFIPETKKIDDLLEEFRTTKVHLALVVNEFGELSGLVSLEDVLEEIVGEISDEYDEEDSRYQRLAEDVYSFEAKTLLTDFFKITGIDEEEFDKFTGDVETVAGLVLEIKGNFPTLKEVVSYGRYSFQVMEISQRRIQRIKLTIAKTSDSAKEQD